jgi:hypothetical protein
MPQHRTSASAAVAIALSLSACADSPTKPQSSPADASTSVSAATAQGPSGFLLQDASARLLPSLGEAKLRLELEHHLDLLAAALSNSDKPRARRQLVLARQTIARQLRTGDVADLGALSLALDQIDEQLDAPSARDESARP